MSRLVRVPVEAIQDWPRAELLTYTAVASTWGNPVTLVEIRKLARLRKQDLLSSLKRLERRGELQRTREPGARISYQVTPPRGRWVRVPVTVLQDPELSKTDVLVYIGLASFASRWKMMAWPAGKTLAKRAGVSLRAGVWRSGQVAKAPHQRDGPTELRCTEKSETDNGASGGAARERADQLVASGDARSGSARDGQAICRLARGRD